MTGASGYPFGAAFFVGFAAAVVDALAAAAATRSASSA